MQVISGSSAHAERSPLKSSGSRLVDVKSKGGVSSSRPSPPKPELEKNGIGSVRDGRRSDAGGAAGGSRISALIADDEPIAREALESMLKREQDVEVIGISRTGREAVDAINELNPDVVFLDIEMPELNGFDVLSRISSARKPAVIFVTANEDFAAKAFDFHAIDYLVKPCERVRLQSALDRVRDQLRQTHAQDLHQKVEALIKELRQEPKSPERIAIKSNGRIVFLRLADIDWAEAADNYVNLHVGGDSHLFRETMNGLETRLSPNRFVRISRSAMVNIEQITELQPMPHGEYAVALRNGTKLTLTRGYREKLRELSLM